MQLWHINHESMVLFFNMLLFLLDNLASRSTWLRFSNMKQENHFKPLIPPQITKSRELHPFQQAQIQYHVHNKPLYMTRTS